MKYPDFQEFIQADENLIKRYVELIKDDGPDKFFEILASENSNKIGALPLAPVSKNCYLQFFAGCEAYGFFERLSENVKKPLADYSCIYWRMQRDKLLREHINKKTFAVFLSNKCGQEFMVLHYEGRAKIARFNEKYDMLKEVFFNEN